MGRGSGSGGREIAAGSTRRPAGSASQRQIEEALINPEPAGPLAAAARSGVLAEALPELVPLLLMTNGTWEHVLQVVSKVPADRRLRWAALLHDVAKPQTMTVDEAGRTRYLGHADAGAPIARACLKRLGWAEPEVVWVEKLVALHMQPLLYRADWSDRAVRRLIADAGAAFDDLLRLARADGSDPTGHDEGRVDPERNEAALAELRRRADALRLAGAAKAPPPAAPVSGKDLLALGMRPGPGMGLILRRLGEAVTAGELGSADRTGALALVERWRAELGL